MKRGKSRRRSFIKFYVGNWEPNNIKISHEALAAQELCCIRWSHQVSQICEVTAFVVQTNCVFDSRGVPYSSMTFRLVYSCISRRTSCIIRCRTYSFCRLSFYMPPTYFSTRRMPIKFRSAGRTIGTTILFKNSGIFGSRG